MIADNIEIMLTRIDRDSVRLRIAAPREIPIFRGELYREIKRLEESQGGHSATGEKPESEPLGDQPEGL